MKKWLATIFILFSAPSCLKASWNDIVTENLNYVLSRKHQCEIRLCDNENQYHFFIDALANRILQEVPNTSASRRQTIFKRFKWQSKWCRRDPELLPLYIPDNIKVWTHAAGEPQNNLAHIILSNAPEKTTLMIWAGISVPVTIILWFIYNRLAAAEDTKISSDKITT